MQSTSLGARTKATLRMYEILIETKLKRTYIHESLTSGQYTIVKEVDKIPDQDHAFLIRLTLEDSKGLQLMEVKEKIIAE